MLSLFPSVFSPSFQQLRGMRSLRRNTFHTMLLNGLCPPQVQFVVCVVLLCRQGCPEGYYIVLLFLIEGTFQLKPKHRYIPGSSKRHKSVNRIHWRRTHESIRSSTSRALSVIILLGSPAVSSANGFTWLAGFPSGWIESRFHLPSGRRFFASSDSAN